MVDRNINIRVDAKGKEKVTQLDATFKMLKATLASITAIVASIVAAFAAITAIIIKTSKAAMEEAVAIRKMNSALDATGRAAGVAKKAIDEMEEAYPLSETNDLADAWTKLRKVMKGATDTEITNATGKVAEFAAVMGTDVNGAMDIVTNAYEAFGTEAGSVNTILGQLYTVSQNNKVGFEELNSAVNRSAADAKAMGYTWEQYLSIVDKLTASGVSARKLGTMFRPENKEELDKYIGSVVDGSDKLAVAFSEIANTGESKIKSLGATFDNFGEDLGNIFLDIGGEFAGALNTPEFKLALTNIIESLKTLVPILSQIAVFAAQVFGNIAMVVTTDIRIFTFFGDKLVNFVLPAFKMLIDVITSFGKQATFMVSILQDLGGLLGLNSGAINNLTANTLPAIKAFETLDKTIGGVLEKLFELGTTAGFAGQAGGAGGMITRTLQGNAGIGLEGLGGGGGELSPETSKEIEAEGVKRKEMTLAEWIYRKQLREADRQEELSQKLRDIVEAKNAEIQADAEAEKKAKKERAKAYGDVLAEGLLSGKMLSAVKSIFGDYLSGLLSSVFSNTVGNLLDSLFSGLTNILKGIPGIGWLFGDKGWIQGEGKIQKFATGDLFGPGISRFNKPTLGIVAEAGVGEITAAMPENAQGVMIASRALRYLEGKTGISGGGSSSSQTIVNITERASQYVDVATAEATARGNRILGNDITN